jgi:ankyrin repeat protein
MIFVLDYWHSLLKNAFVEWLNYTTLDSVKKFVEDNPDFPIAINDRGWNCLLGLLTIEFGSTPIIREEECAFKRRLMEYLISKGANPKIVTNSGSNLLHSAVSRKYAGITQFLLEIDVDPDAKSQGKTPLDMCKDDVCKRLLVQYMNKSS